MNVIVKHIMRIRNTFRRHLKMMSLKLQYGDSFKYKKFHFRKDFSVIIEEDGVVDIGKNVFFNTGCSITARKLVQIGDDCVFGENVHIYDHNHEYRDKTTLISKQGFNSENLVIGKDCWIASNVVILKGVHIGEHSVVGAGVVVYKDLPANSITVCKQNLDIKISE